MRVCYFCGGECAVFKGFGYYYNGIAFFCKLTDKAFEKARIFIASVSRKNDGFSSVYCTCDDTVVFFARQQIEYHQSDNTECQCWQKYQKGRRKYNEYGTGFNKGYNNCGVSEDACRKE